MKQVKLWMDRSSSIHFLIFKLIFQHQGHRPCSLSVSGLTVFSMFISADDPGLSVDADSLSEVQSGANPTADGKIKQIIHICPQRTVTEQLQNSGTQHGLWEDGHKYSTQTAIHCAGSQVNDRQ